MKRLIAVLLLCGPIVVTQVQSSEKVFLDVPEVGWEELEPYLIANLRVEIKDDVVFVGTSGAARERDLFEPYDNRLGEWATVLLIHLTDNRKVTRSLRRVARELVNEDSTAAELSRVELTERFWRRLEAQGRFVPRVRELYDRTQQEGRFRCRICENGYEPKYLRWQ